MMLAEQTLVNGAVLSVDAIATDAALAGVVFSVLLIARAPLQLFQAIQGTLLPHLAPLQATAGRAEFRGDPDHAARDRGVRASRSRWGCSSIGPFALGVLFDVDYDYGRGGLAILALGVGCHLAAGTLNQAALARGQTAHAAMAWLAAAALFLGWMFTPVIDDELVRAEVGYFGAAALLASPWPCSTATRTRGCPSVASRPTGRARLRPPELAGAPRRPFAGGLKSGASVVTEGERGSGSARQGETVDRRRRLLPLFDRMSWTKGARGPAPRRSVSRTRPCALGEPFGRG